MSAFVSGGDAGAVSYQDVLRIGRGYVCKGLRMCLACHSGRVNVVDSNVMMTTVFLSLGIQCSFQYAAAVSCELALSQNAHILATHVRPEAWPPLGAC